MSRKVEHSSIWIVGLLILAVATNRAMAISCLEAITTLMPCQSFLLGTSNGVTVPCCEGAASLNQLVVADRGEMKNLCVCFKKAAASMGVNPDRAKQLPELCNINVPLSIDPNINCDAIPLSKSSFELNRDKYLGSKGQSVPSPGAGHGTQAHAH